MFFSSVTCLLAENGRITAIKKLNKDIHTISSELNKLYNRNNPKLTICSFSPKNDFTR